MASESHRIKNNALQECRQNHVQTGLDSADIVRERISRHLSGPSRPGPSAKPSFRLRDLPGLALKPNVIFGFDETARMMKSISVSKERLAWLLLSTAAMFVSAYSFFGWLGTVGRISGWTGLPQYEAQIPRLRVQAEVWLGLAVASPFLAAWFLGLGRKSSSINAKSLGPCL
jgi:hypothetical protein